MRLEWFGIIEFNEENIKKLQNKGGVYRLSVKHKNGDWIVFYIGKSEDLKRRLLEYLSGGDGDECVQKRIKNKYVSFKYAYVDSEEDRKNIEYTLYKNYNPECNDVEPEGNKIEINFD